METQTFEVVVVQEEGFTTAEAGQQAQAHQSWESFPEPRGWALQWDGGALAAAEARQGGQDSEAKSQ